MNSGDGLGPLRMQRIAIVAPTAVLRDALVRVADAGVVEFDRVDGPTATDAPYRTSEGATASRPDAVEPVLARITPDLDDLTRRGAAANVELPQCHCSPFPKRHSARLADPHAGSRLISANLNHPRPLSR